MLLNNQGAQGVPDETDIVREDGPNRDAGGTQGRASNSSTDSGVRWQVPPRRRPAGGNADQDRQSESAHSSGPSTAGTGGDSPRPEDASRQAAGGSSWAQPGKPPLGERIKRPSDAATARRLAEFWAAKQAEAVARKVESSIAATPQLGAVHPNVIMRLMQALMRILRLLFEKLGIHNRPGGPDNEDPQRDESRFAGGGVRFNSSAPSGAQAAAAPAADQRPQNQTAKAQQAHAAMPDGVADAAHAVAQPSYADGFGERPQAAGAVDAQGMAAHWEAEKTTADVVSAAMIRLAEDEQVRHRMQTVGDNSALQTAVFMSAVVNCLRDRARLVQDHLSAYGGALNLRLARHAGQCASFGGHTAAALLLQNGVIQPQDISPAFAQEVRDITARYQPHLDELNLLRTAVTESAREVYQCSTDSPLQEQLLREMDGALTDLLGKDWRQALALERMGSAPDDDEVDAAIRSMHEQQHQSGGAVESPTGPIASEPRQAEGVPEAPASSGQAPRVDVRNEADSPPPVPSRQAPAPAPAQERTAPSELFTQVLSDPDPEPGSFPSQGSGEEAESIGAVSGQAVAGDGDTSHASKPGMSRDEAMAQLALLDTDDDLQAGRPDAPAAPETYGRERG